MFPLQAAADFDWEIKVDGTEINYWNNAVISADCGVGLSGVTMAQFTFDIPKRTYDISLFRGGQNVSVRGRSQGGMDSSAGFVLYSANVNGDVITITAYDKAMTLDAEITLKDEDFSGKPTGTGKTEYRFVNKNTSSGNEDDTTAVRSIATSAVMSKISSDCGVQITLPNGFAQSNPTMRMDSVYQKSCRSILEDIASASGGFFMFSQQNARMVFIPFSATGEATGGFTYYSKIKAGNTRTYDSVVMKGNSMTYTAGSSEWRKADTHETDTQFASQKNCDALLTAIQHPVQGWNCDNVSASAMYFPGVIVSFAGGEKYALRRVRMKLGKMLMCSMGFDVPSRTYTYIPLNQRSLAERIANGEINKNVKVSKSGGLQYVFVKEDKA